MLLKIVLFVSCVYIVQASLVTGTPENHSDGVTNFADVVLSRSRRSCGPSECNAHCKKLGHARGVCIGTYCQCRSRLRRSVDTQNAENIVDSNSKIDSEVTNYADVVLSRSRRSCGPSECNAHCKKLGHARGVCIGTYCQCRSRRRRSPTAELNNEVDTKIPESAPLIKLEEKLEDNSDLSTFDDVTKSRSARSTCGYDECNRFCRKLGHARGVCIGNYCQCRFR